MACLKCGKETENAQVFCQECLQVMANYPVKPGTKLLLPVREPVPAEKKAAGRKDRELSAEAMLRRLVRGLTVTIAVLTLIICLLAGLLLWNDFVDRDNVIGRNYTIDTSATGGS